MKQRLGFLLMVGVVVAFIGCSLSTGPTVITQTHEVKKEPYFLGTWTWVKTELFGITYSELDSTTKGYSIHFDFDDDTLRTYHNGVKDKIYNYTYTLSDTDSTKQILVLTDSTGQVTEYLWKQYAAVTNGTDSQMIVLRNSLMCCDNEFNMYFRRIGTHTP